MISEVAVALSAEVAKEAATETAKDLSKDIGKASFEKTVDISKRVDVTKTTAAIDSGRVDVSKRIHPETITEIGKPDISTLIKEYISDLREKSAFGETITNKALNDSKLELKTPEKLAEMREDFEDNKSKLRKEWETLNNREWPKYTQDVKNENGVTIRKAGDNFDAHHIQPLQLGGENVASNLTPMDLAKHAEIHSKDGSCSKLVKTMEGVGAK